MLKKLIFTICLAVVYLNGSNFGTITTGSNSGTYIQIGNDISHIFQKYNVKLQVVNSEGSIDNLKRILGEDKQHLANWAIVQKDALKYYKFQYFKHTKENLNNKVKSVFPLYNEDIHIFTKKNKQVKFQSHDIIKVGVKGEKSGGYITAKIIENFYDVQFQFVYSDFETAKGYLEKGVIDIFIDVTAKPNSEYTDLKNIDFVVLPENQLMDQNYGKSVFTKEEYPWLEKNSFGYACPSVIVTNLVDPKYDKVVKFFVDSLLKNFEVLTHSGHPRWKEVYKNLNLQNFNYHPQVAETISSYQTKF